MAEPVEAMRGCPRCAALERRIAELERLLEQRTGDTQRQAAPFSKGLPRENPDPPGRKAGEDYGTKAFRNLPERDPDEIIDVPLPKSCPHCGGRTPEEQVDQPFQVEIPCCPILRRFDFPIGICTGCGHRIQPRQELQTSDALGAAAAQIGPDIQAPSPSSRTNWAFPTATSPSFCTTAST